MIYIIYGVGIILGFAGMWKFGNADHGAGFVLAILLGFLFWVCVVALLAYYLASTVGYPYGTH